MFDNRLKKLKMAKNLTQEEVAKALGLPKTTYCNYERDEREPSAMTLLKISAYFGVSLDYLCGNEGEKNSPPPQSDEEAKIIDALKVLEDSEIKDLDKYVDFLLFKRGLL